MATKEYSLTINEEHKIVTLTGITEKSISVDYSGDVDFTSLVNELASFMDSKTLLTCRENIETIDDESLNLVLETIDKIIEEFNTTVSSLIEDDLKIESDSTE